jgi:ferredoxin
MRIFAIYFSGTGNTEFVVQAIGAEILAKGCEFNAVSIESFGEVDTEKVKHADFIIFAYPVYGSMAPRIIREFVAEHHSLFAGKTAGVVVTQLMFSGDGGAYFARILRRYGIKVVDIAHFNMPSNLSDADVFKIKNGAANKKLIEAAKCKAVKYAERILSGSFKRTGDNTLSRLLGLFQRVPFRRGEASLSQAFNIDSDLCNLCGRCVRCCPMKNLFIEGENLEHHRNCTLCYRCVNLCPQKALSVLTKKKPTVQYKGPAQ